MEFIIMLIIQITMGIIGATMAENRNRSTIGGFFLGFLLGLIGLAIIALMGRAPKGHEYKYSEDINPTKEDK